MDLSPTMGSEQGGIRPAVVVQNDMSNEYNLTRDSVVLLEQVRVLDKRRFKEKIGKITEADMRRIEKSILIQFSLSYNVLICS